MMAAVAPLPAGGIALLCDAYGGKIADVAADATRVSAPRRDAILHSILFKLDARGRHASSPGAGRKSLRGDAAAYAGASYVNYCGSRSAGLRTHLLGRQVSAALVAVKQQYDPDNLFHHAQSVPVSLPTV